MIDNHHDLLNLDEEFANEIDVSLQRIIELDNYLMEQPKDFLEQYINTWKNYKKENPAFAETAINLASTYKEMNYN